MAKDVEPSWLSKPRPEYTTGMDQAIQIKNIIQVMQLVAQASLAREVIRGALYRRDFPKTDNVNWLKNITVQKDGDKTRLTITDVDLKYFKPARVIRDYGLKE